MIRVLAPTGTDALAPARPGVETRVAAAVRPVPYPYRALLAICSDLDETPGRRVYRETMRFLNTTETTGMGPGVGLEAGNTIYFDMPARQFSYWNTDDQGRAMLRALMRSGHVDCLHSFGDLATTRDHASRALDELARQDCRLEVWVDHGVAPTNFGEDIMRGSGDVPGAAAFHANLTCAYGIKYVWRGRVTSVIGQSVGRRLAGIYDTRHPVGSLRTISKELAKGALGRAGHRKYRIHGTNEAIRKVRLRSGHAVYEFLRSNPHWAGVNQGETAAGLGSVLTPNVLDRLVDRGGTCILYTHLGKVRDDEQPLPHGSREALRRLARYQHGGKVLVTTTRRVLGYCHARQNAAVSMVTHDTWEHVQVTPGADEPGSSERDLAGLTIYVRDPEHTRLWIGAREIHDFDRNPPDESGRTSVSLRWPRLEFPRV